MALRGLVALSLFAQGDARGFTEFVASTLRRE